MSLSNEPSVFAVSATLEPGARQRDESVWQWLERSSEPAAEDPRAPWGNWLSRMPPEPRAALIRRLQDRNDEQVRAALRVGHVCSSRHDLPAVDTPHTPALGITDLGQCEQREGPWTPGNGETLGGSEAEGERYIGCCLFAYREN